MGGETGRREWMGERELEWLGGKEIGEEWDLKEQEHLPLY